MAKIQENNGTIANFQRDSYTHVLRDASVISYFRSIIVFFRSSNNLSLVNGMLVINAWIFRKMS